MNKSHLRQTMQTGSKRTVVAMVLAFVLMFGGQSFAADLVLLAPSDVLNLAIPVEAIPEFEALHNVTVDVIPTGWGLEELFVMQAAGIPPDVHYAFFLERGATMDLTPYIDRWDERDQFVPDWLLEWEGQIIAVPFAADYRGTLMNTRLFAESGLDPTPPQSWEEMYEAARRLTRVQDDIVVQAGWQMSFSNQGFEQLVYQNGGDMLDRTEKQVLFNSPEGVEALEYMKDIWDLWNLGQPLPGNVGGSAFAEGRVGMVDAGAPAASNYVAQNPNIDAEMVLFAPRRSPAHDPVAFGYRWFLSIPSNVRDPDLAWELLSFLVSRKALETKLASGSPGTLWGRFDMAQASPTQQPFLSRWYSILENVRTAPLLVNQGMVGEVVQRALRGEIPASAALTDLEQRHQAYLDDWWSRY